MYGRIDILCGCVGAGEYGCMGVWASGCMGVWVYWYMGEKGIWVHDQDRHVGATGMGHVWVSRLRRAGPGIGSCQTLCPQWLLPLLLLVGSYPVF